MARTLILNQEIADGLEIIGDRWTMLILREAFQGRTRFEEFKSNTGASRTTLTRRLTTLTESAILVKRPYGNSSSRFDYHLTQSGLGLLGASLLAGKWETDWQTTGYENLPQKIIHQSCGHPLQPQAVCRHCGEELKFGEVSWPEMAENLEQQMAFIRSRGAGHRKRLAQDDNADMANLIGDRWSLMLLIAAFFGSRRYDEFRAGLSMPTNILAARLKHLVANKIFARSPYQDNPPRYEYQLTDKAKDLFPFVMLLRQWVAEAMLGSKRAIPLLHSKCGQPLAIDIVCGACHEIPAPDSLSY